MNYIVHICLDLYTNRYIYIIHKSPHVIRHNSISLSQKFIVMTAHYLVKWHNVNGFNDVKVPTAFCLKIELPVELHNFNRSVFIGQRDSDIQKIIEANKS